MKTYNVSVPDEKVKFISELFKNLGLSYSISSSQKAHDEVAEPPKSYEIDEESRKKAAKVREESLKDVINRIEAMRKK